VEHLHRIDCVDEGERERAPRIAGLLFENHARLEWRPKYLPIKDLTKIDRCPELSSPGDN
jgi:hypothetical protein